MEILFPFELQPDQESLPQIVLAPRSTRHDRVLGLVDNNKDATGRRILEDVGEEFVRQGFASEYFIWTKRGATWTITESEVATVLARAHLVITGVGT